MISKSLILLQLLIVITTEYYIIVLIQSMSFSSRNSNERISEGPKYYESIAQGEQSVKDEFYYNRMEEHLEFMEREFKLSLLWQRELMKQIKSTKNIDQEPCTRRNKELHTIHINSQEQYMLRKLLKRYC